MINVFLTVECVSSWNNPTIIPSTIMYNLLPLKILNNMLIILKCINNIDGNNNNNNSILEETPLPPPPKKKIFFLRPPLRYIILYGTPFHGELSFGKIYAPSNAILNIYNAITSYTANNYDDDRLISRKENSTRACCTRQTSAIKTILFYVFIYIWRTDVNLAKPLFVAITASRTRASITTPRHCRLACTAGQIELSFSIVTNYTYNFCAVGSGDAFMRGFE